MFRSITLSLAALLCTGAFAAQPEQPLSGCAAKQAAIAGKLEEARARGDKGAIAGLETALEKARTYCTDGSLTQKRTQRVLDAEREVSQRESDLRKAMNKGDAEKIEKRKDKLAEARAELEQAKRELEE
ncbi:MULTISPECIES: DUF1090 domain-containing protein [Pseudomonas]|jgi:hypothetical protein|uniref:DUF1090 domain-containing protein n=1 Tax=Pseudomonas TaxID=286 RepID=UPI0004D7B5B3|nr:MULTISPECIES: DUF1090 domain-containing protein [Pseudomonas]AMO79174.1 hypothetical protein PcP3B5_58110 [Pseudomonas citronellolis]KES24677.1 hypothetical protein FG99_08840 [Pseudomonas sp. AAC]KWR85000.1 hypothetical protein RN02_03960 [Pseudomonas sp. PI1]OHR95302.1 hypothetical protein HMPREF3289_19125 [Pseudomonas sp. HMSC75E02]WAB93559.1 DUF1090 domain-containing protein [Pseudomonas citronellolis]